MIKVLLDFESGNLSIQILSGSGDFDVFSDSSCSFTKCSVISKSFVGWVISNSGMLKFSGCSCVKTYERTLTKLHFFRSH